MRINEHLLALIQSLPNSSSNHRSIVLKYTTPLLSNIDDMTQLNIMFYNFGIGVFICG